MKRYIITLIVVTTISATNGVSNGEQCDMNMNMCIGTVCSAPSATETVVLGTKTTRLEKFVYTCPMHPEVISEKIGKCPKCKMNLKIKKSDAYCPHDNTRLIKKGKKLYCPKCKMNLKIKKSDAYCPHDNTRLIKKGKKLYCPKCKMIVKPKNDKIKK